MPVTVINNFICGIIKVKVDVDLYSFKKDETLYLDPKYATTITESEWKKVIDEISQDNEEYLKNLEKNKQTFKISKRINKRRKNYKKFVEKKSD